MSNKMKKLFIGLFILLCTFTLVSCKKDDAYNYPSKSPMISNATETFVGYDNWKVTNERAYVKLVSSYGYAEILNWLDEIIYASELNSSLEGFTAYLNTQKYGVEDTTELTKKEQATLDKAWEESWKNNGFATEAEAETYYKLQYVRKEAARKEVVKSIDEFNVLVNVLNGIDFPLYVTEDLDLKVADKSVSEDLEIKWASNSKYVEIDDEKAEVTRGKYDVEVTLTATISLEELSTTATYKFTVPATGAEVSDTTSKAEKEVVEYFTTAKYESYLSANYQGKVKTAFVTFDSDREAREALKAAGVNVLGLTGQAWTNASGVALTEAEVKEVFVKLHNATNSTKVTSFTEMVEEYSYADLSAFNATACTTIYGLASLNNLEEEETIHNAYTILPVAYGTKFIVAVNVEEEALPELEAKKAEITEKLIDQEVTSKYITYNQINTILNKGTVHIYAEGLENKFVQAVASAYSGVSKEVKEYTRTEGVSDTVVVQFELDGTTHKLTADDLFARLVKRHGTDLAISYLNEYVVLQNSFVYNYLTGEVENKEKYDDYFENTVTTVKDAFEAGDYEVAGYPNNYGWENFLRDHLGVTKEIELLYAVSSDLYKEAYEKYEEALTIGKHEDIVGIATEIFNETFKVNAYALSVYVDADDDANADKLAPEVLDTEDVEDFYSLSAADFWAKYSEKYAAYGATAEEFAAAKATLTAAYEAQKAFVEVLYDIVELSYGQITVDEIANSAIYAGKDVVDELTAIAEAIALDNEKAIDRMNDLKTYYSIAPVTSQVFGQFKLANLQITVTSSTSFANTSSISETYKSTLKALYDEIINYQAAYEAYEKDGSKKAYVYGTDITGKDLDPFYSYNKKNDITGETSYYVVAPQVSDVFFNIDRATKVIVTTATDKAKISKKVATLLDEEGKDVLDENGAPVQYVKYEALEFLTEANYKKYQLELDDDKDTTSGLTSAQKSVFSTYYIAAIDKLVADSADQMVQTQITLANDAKFAVNSLITKEALIKALEENLAE